MYLRYINRESVFAPMKVAVDKYKKSVLTKQTNLCRNVKEKKNMKSVLF